MTEEKPCKHCGKPRPKGRPKWCSEECSDLAFLKRHGRNGGTVLRYLLYRRDKGVCKNCGLDCSALSARLSRMRAENREAWRAALAVLEEMGFSVMFSGRQTLWDADHIVPLAEGGSWHPDNAQTLCQPCHKEKTAEQVGRKARQQRLVGWKHDRGRRRRVEEFFHEQEVGRGSGEAVDGEDHLRGAPWPPPPNPDP